MSYCKRPRIFVSEGHRKGWLIKTTLTRRQNCFESKPRNVSELTEEYDVECSTHDAYQFVLDGLLKLDDKYRAVLYLYCFEAYLTKEIDSILNVKEGTVWIQMKCGREN